MNERQALIAKVLTEHEWRWKAATPQRLVLVCQCGDELIPVISSGVASLDDHTSHVAEMVDHALTQVLLDRNLAVVMDEIERAGEILRGDR